MDGELGRPLSYLVPGTMPLLKRLPLRKGQRRRNLTGGDACRSGSGPGGARRLPALFPLGRRRHRLVFGEGNPQAELVFVGEAPGADEDAQGRPFVGRAGQLLTKIIEAMGLKREEVYICNILKCRPPGNRNPQPDEIAACEPFLIRQLEAIRPRVICALGTFAAHTLLKSEAPISVLRGTVPRLSGDPADADLSPGLSAPESRGEKTGLGGCPDDHEGAPGGEAMTGYEAARKDGEMNEKPVRARIRSARPW